MVTDIPDTCLAVLIADCVPMVFFDPLKRVVGVAHAGWRGTLQLIASKTIRTMEKAYGSSPQDVMVGMGPSIGPCCYRVGPEVIVGVEDVFPDQKGHLLHQSEDGGRYLDLWEANLRQLVTAGVERENIEMARQCTCHNPDLFFSYRFQKGNTGRFGAGIMLR
jgi:YfiH family protein